MKKEINNWFKGLDSFTLAFIFPSIYEEVMMSADPDHCTINDFVDDVNEEWDRMSDEQKEKLYNQYKDA